MNEIQYRVKVLSQDDFNRFEIQSVVDFGIRDSRYKHIAIHILHDSENFPEVITTGHNSDGQPIVGLVNGDHLIDVTFTGIDKGDWTVLMFETIGNMIHLLLVDVSKVSGL